MVTRLAPQVVLNTAAYTDVDGAEREPDIARAINAEAPLALARAARRARSAFIHFSTDYVFDGALRRPYTENDSPNPINVYGETKLEGERAIQAEGGSCLVLRTSWVYSLRRRGFVPRLLEWARSQDRIRVVVDQIGSPTWCRLVAEAAAFVIARSQGEPFAYLQQHAGLYHLACRGTATRLEWARQTLALDPHRSEHRVAPERIEPASSADFSTPARRPAFSALDSGLFQRVFGLRLPPWQDALRLAMDGG